MAHLPYSIELHDSEVSSIETFDGAVVVKFSKAYVHKDGKGYSQDAELTIGSATIETNQTKFPVRADDGTLDTKLGPYHNLLTIPLDTDGGVDLNIDFQSGNFARIKGIGISLAFTSEAVFIEDVS